MYVPAYHSVCVPCVACTCFNILATLTTSYVFLENFLCAKQQYGVNVTTNNMEVVERSQIIWLAVKPHAIGRVLREVTPVVRPDQMIISTAAGIPIKEIEKVCYVSKTNNKPSLQEYSHGSGYVCLQTCQD